LLLAAPLLCAFDPFRSTNSHVEEGNAKLGAGKLKEALEHYEKAAKELPDEPGVQYNLGIARFQLGQLDPARQALVKATTAGDRDLRAKAFYNLGNVQLEQKQYKAAVGSYVRSLQLQPGHRASKWNLELALRKQKEEEKKKKEQEKKDQQKKKDQKKDGKQDQKQDKADQKKDQREAQKKQPDRKKDQQKQQQQQQARKDQGRPKPPPEMDSVLDALDRNDRNLQKQRARLQTGGDLPRPSKDW